MVRPCRAFQQGGVRPGKHDMLVFWTIGVSSRYGNHKQINIIATQHQAIPAAL